MSKPLVIVDSPAKAKTIGRYLGKGYTVRASVGHVRDLLKSTLSVDVDHDFAPKYRVPNEKRQLVKELKATAAQAESVYLATDQTARAKPLPGTCSKRLRLSRSARVAWPLTRSPSPPFRKPSSIPAKLRWIWWMPSKPAASWTGWWGIR